MHIFETEINIGYISKQYFGVEIDIRYIPYAYFRNQNQHKIYTMCTFLKLKST